jgi:hypothetical protein
MIKNDQICIQTIKFIFKQSNLNSNGPIRSWQWTTAHRLQWRALPPGPTLVWAVSSDLDERYPYRPVPLPRLPRRVVSPGHQAIAPSGRVLPPATGTSLSCSIKPHNSKNNATSPKLAAQEHKQSYCERKLRDRDEINLCHVYSLIPSFYTFEDAAVRWRTRWFGRGRAWWHVGATVADTVVAGMRTIQVNAYTFVF